MFHGDGVPDYLLTKEFFQQLKQCSTKNSVIVMNTFEDRSEPQVRNAILATVASAFSNVGYFLDSGSSNELRNAFIVASNQNLAATPRSGETAPLYLVPSINATLSGGEIIDQSSYDYAAPLSDNHNIYSVLSLRMNMHYRKSIQGVLPDILYKS